VASNVSLSLSEQMTVVGAIKSLYIPTQPHKQHAFNCKPLDNLPKVTSTPFKHCAVHSVTNC